MKLLNYSLLTSVMALTTASSVAQVYDVVDMGGVENTRHSFATGVNNVDQVVGISKDAYDFPIDWQNLNIAILTVELTTLKSNNPGVYDDVDIEQIKVGNINANSLIVIKYVLNKYRDDITFQKMGNQTAFISTAGQAQELTFFDQVDPDLNRKTRNTIDIVNAINNDGVLVATTTALYHKVSYTPAATEAIPEPTTLTYWTKDFYDTKGVISKGDLRTVVESPSTDLGGTSALTDISDSGYVVGYAATGLSLNGQTGFDTYCATLTDSVELYNCIWGIKNTLNNASPADILFKVRAMRWKIDQNLQVTEATDLGLVFTPKEADLLNHFSMALGVNEQGHVAGFSKMYKDDSDRQYQIGPRDAAVYYDGSQMISIVDQTKYASSKALAINDQDKVVGYAIANNSAAGTKRMFIYDGQSHAITYPLGFFESSSTVGYGINNAGMVVGIAEVESVNGSARRQRGFIYDIGLDKMTDLNSLISCNNNTIVAEARGISDNGVIVGTGLIDVAKKDSLGNPILDSSGAAVIETVARAIKLVPVAGGVADDCDGSVVDTYERKGAGFGGLGLLFLAGLCGFSRLIGLKDREIKV